MQIFIDCGAAGLRGQNIIVTQSWPGILESSKSAVPVLFEMVVSILTSFIIIFGTKLGIAFFAR